MTCLQSATIKAHTCALSWHSPFRWRHRHVKWQHWFGFWFHFWFWWGWWWWWRGPESMFTRSPGLGSFPTYFQIGLIRSFFLHMRYLFQIAFFFHPFTWRYSFMKVDDKLSWLVYAFWPNMLHTFPLPLISVLHTCSFLLLVIKFLLGIMMSSPFFVPVCLYRFFYHCFI